MSRAATTSDVFNAIAEPARRDVLGVLAGGEQPVGAIVAALELTQPQVSKHLSVLRTVDLVRCRSHGRQRLYRLNGPALRPVHDWVAGFAAQWNERLDRLDDVLAEMGADEAAADAHAADAHAADAHAADAHAADAHAPGAASERAVR